MEIGFVEASYTRISLIHALSSNPAVIKDRIAVIMVTDTSVARQAGLRTIDATITRPKHTIKSVSNGGSLSSTSYMISYDLPKIAKKNKWRFTSSNQHQNSLSPSLNSYKLLGSRTFPTPPSHMKQVFSA